MNEQVQAGCRVVLVGMMGSGKSSVGRLLAERTGWPLYDNDALLHELYGMTAREIVDSRGEPAKRDAENAALAAGLSKPAPFILDAAAGTITSAESRQAMGDAIVVWLHAPPDVLYRRAVGGTHRPFLDGGVKWFEATTAERDPLYRAVADIDIDSSQRPPDEIARQVWLRLREFCPELRIEADTAR